MGARKELECVCLSVLSLVGAGCVGYDVWTADHGLGYRVVAGGVVVLLLAASGVLADIARQHPANSHTWRTLALQYVIMTVLAAIGWRVYRKFVASSKRVRSVQEALLLRILRHNEDTVYGAEHAFSAVKTLRDFTDTHPLVVYADLKPHFDRIKDGEQNVMTKDPVIFLALSSGTTGRNKVIPITPFMRGPAAYDAGPLMYYFSKKKSRMHMQRVVVLSYKTRVQRSQCGLPMAPVSTHMARYVPFVVSPQVSYEITNEQVALHVHAVFALSEPEVGHIESLMSTLVYSFWVYVEHNWRRLCDDIEVGQLSVMTDPEIISKLNEHLRPNPCRAAELRIHFRSNSWHGVAKRVWPRLYFVRMLSTGGCAHHAKALRDCHMSGVIQVSMLHAASEGFLGVNLSADPDDFNYHAMITYGFMEFIPEVATQEEQPATLFAEQLQKGDSYEIVLTTPIGLYRYRTGDIVKVVDYLNQCPVYEFQYRTGQLLNLYWEKTPECVFYAAVGRAVGELGGLTLVDYSATEDLFVAEIEGTTSSVKHYVLMIELKRHDGNVVALLDSEKAKFDTTLCAIFEMYATFRHNGSIAPMRVVQLRPRSFERLKDKMTEHLQNQQYKVPRVLRNIEYLTFLLDQRL